MFPSYFPLLLLFASLSDAQVFLDSGANFQGKWVNGNETALPNVQACGSVTQTPGSSVTVEPQGQPLFSKEERRIDPRCIGLSRFVVYGRFPPDPSTITAELDGAAIPLTPITAANPTGCNNLLYDITLVPTLHKLTFTFTGTASNNNFFA
jgi:hypothetical protein